MMKDGDHTDFIRNLSAAYTLETGIVPEIYGCEIGDGVEEVTTR